MTWATMEPMAPTPTDLRSHAVGGRSWNLSEGPIGSSLLPLDPRGSNLTAP